MSDISVKPIANVEVRCQFKTIPGVCHIYMTHRPQRGFPYSISFDLLGTKLSLDEEAIFGVLTNDIKEFSSDVIVKLFTNVVRKELFEACVVGMKTLNTMAKSVK